MNTTSHPLTTWWLVRNRPHAALCAFASLVPDLPYFAALLLGIARGLPAIALGLATHRPVQGAIFSAITTAWATPWANFLAQKMLHNLVLSSAFAAIAWTSGNDRAKAIALGWMLHVWVDFSLHVNDAYAVLWPFTRRVFPAPVSYWDTDHHGRLMGAILGGLAAILWAMSARRAWRLRQTTGEGARPLIRLFAAGGFVLLALVSAAGAIFGGPAESRRIEASWIDDGIDWPADLVPLAAALATGSPADALATIKALPPPADTAGALPWEVHHGPAHRALLRGYALDLGRQRNEAIAAYFEAESLEPVGNVGDKARRYEGEPFRNVPDPKVSRPWIALFVWGFAGCAVQLAFLRKQVVIS